MSFSKATKKIIKNDAYYHCMNPTCFKFLGINDGECAHIIPVSAKGPRAKFANSCKNNKSSLNGLYLCSTCHKHIDTYSKAHPPELLKSWRIQHVNKVLQVVQQLDEAFKKITLENKNREIARKNEEIKKLKQRLQKRNKEMSKLDTYIKNILMKLQQN